MARVHSVNHRRREQCTRLISPVFVILATIGIQVTVTRAQSPADRFVAGLESDAGLSAEARELIRTTWEQCDDCDGEEFLTQGLAVLSPQFRQGLDAYDADDYGQCAAIMRGLRSDSRLFIATNAAAYEIKSLVQMDRLLEASRRIDELSGDGKVATYSYFSAEIDFLRGYCLLGDLQYRSAAEAMERFLHDHADASQRLVITAQQILVELTNRQPERIGEVADLMTFCGRRLSHADTGEVVRGRQERAIELLDRLIEDAEQQESKSGSSSGGGGSGSSGGRSPNSPLQESLLPGGSAKEGPLRTRRRANPGEVWGNMPPAERERILQALRDSFPSQYRRLVEQYYEELAKKP